MPDMSKASAENNNCNRDDVVEMVETVDALGEETRELALNLALYLAKAKANKASEKLRQMEPEFIRLVNSTVKVIQEVTVILNAARNQEKMVYQLPSGKVGQDHIQKRLESIAEQCNQILGTLRQATDLMA